MPTLQIVITKSPDGYTVILMDIAHVTFRGSYPTREHVLAAVADFMIELALPPKATA